MAPKLATLFEHLRWADVRARRGGGTPNPTDYIVFLRGDPAPDQERPG